MNKQYLENLYNKLQNEEDLSRTERELVFAYDKTKEYEYDWIGFDEVSSLNYKELVSLMREAEVDEIYITGEWSNQFANWFDMQEAGLEMVGVMEIDNPRYLYDVKRYGKSWDKQTQYVLVFRLKK
jgi:choline kinase